MATHSSTLGWRIPWTEEPGELQSMGSLRVGHDWATSLSLFTFMHWRRKWQPTPLFLPWRIPGTGKPGGLPSLGLHRVGHDCIDLAAAAASTTTEPVLWSLGTTTTEPMHPRACIPQEKPLQWEACALQLESSPSSPQLEISQHRRKTQNSQKWINKQNNNTYFVWKRNSILNFICSMFPALFLLS